MRVGGAVRLYALGTSGARWRAAGLRWLYDPLAGARRTRRRRPPHSAGRRARQPRVGGLACPGVEPPVQPGPRRGAGGFPAGGRRRSSGCRGVSRRRDDAVAQHYVRARQHDGGRLHRPRDEADGDEQTGADRNRHRVSRRDREGDRARAPAHREECERRRRALSARRRRRPARVVHRDRGRQRRRRVSRRARSVRRARAGADARAAAQGRRPHRRDVSVHRRDARAAAPVDGVRRGLRRRT